MSKTDLRLSTNTDSQGGQPVCIVIVQAGKTVATCYNTTPESEAQLAEIVRRHNAYEELVEVIEGLFRECEMVHRHWGEGCNSKQADEAKAQAKAVLASAKAKP
jgi:hypothetical protein